MDIGFVRLAVMGHCKDWVTILEKNNLIRFDQFNRCFSEKI